MPLVAMAAPLPGPLPVPQQAVEIRPRLSNQAWRIDSFVVDAGLEDACIFQAAVERNGMAWFATSRGLHRFDGYHWKKFSTSEGLPSEYIRSVTVTSSDELWVGTDKGAGVFSNGRFQLLAPPSTLAGPSVRRIVEGPDGTLWFCCDRWPRASVKAGLTGFKNGSWVHYGVEEGLPDDYVSDVFFESTGTMFVLTRSGLAQLEGQRFRQPLIEAGINGANEYVWSLVEPAPGELLLASSSTFFRRVGGTWSKHPGGIGKMRYPSLLQTRDGEIFGLGQSQITTFRRWDGKQFVSVTETFPWYGQGIQDLIEAPNGAVWCVGDHTILRWDRNGSSMKIYEGLPPPSLMDSEGGVLFANSELVMRVHEGEWYVFPGLRGPIVSDGEGGAWMTSDASVAHWSPDGAIRVAAALPANIRLQQLAGMDPQGTVWVVGDDESDWLVMGLSGEEWQVWPAGPRALPAPRVSCDPVDSGVWTSVEAPVSSTKLLRFQINQPETLEIALPDDFLNFSWTRARRTVDGKLWAYGFFGARYLDDLQSTSWQMLDGLPNQHLSEFIQTEEALWFLRQSTTGGHSGFSHFANGKWTHRHGLPRQLVGLGTGGGPITARRDRLYLPNLESPLHELVIKTHSTEHITSAVEDQDGAFWVASGEHVHWIMHETAPPETSIVEFVDDTLESEELWIHVRSHQRFRPLEKMDSMEIQASIDDGPWHSLGTQIEGPVRLETPGVGSHKVAIRSVSPMGIADPTPTTRTFRVLPSPLQSRPWFRPALATLFLAVLSLAAFGLMTRRRLTQQTVMLKDLVGERTRAWLDSEFEFRTLFEESRDAILLCDEDGGIRSANLAAELLFDSPSPDSKLQSINEFFDEPLDLASTAESRSAPRRITRNGETQSVLLSISPLENEPNGTVGYLLIAQDVTRQTQLEEQVHHGMKMEAIGRMAGGIAHEFHNILTSILGYCELLIPRVNQDPDLLKDVEVVRDQALRARDLTGQIQSFSRVDLGKPEPVDLNQVVASTDKLLHTSTPSHINLKYSLDPSVGRAQLVPGKVEQAIVNLVLNAIDAMPEGGQVLIQTKALRTPSDFEWQISVTDSGTGMDEGTRRRIFEPFFTTKPPGKGTGLGLAVVYGTVDQLGGTIEVSSEPGKGARFEITVPSTEEEPQGIPEPAAVIEPSSCTGKILLVEDEDSIRVLLEKVLARAGYDVCTAADGAQALDVWKNSGADFDLLITDMVMPGVSGKDVSETLLKYAPALQVILISGQPGLQAQGLIGSQTSFAFLAKPFASGQLLELVAQKLGRQATRTT